MPAASASAGPADRHGPAVDPDLARIGAVEAEQDVHQRGLAGAVLAEQADHLAGMDREVDRAVGVHRAEALVDAAKLEQRRRHAAVYSERGVLSSTGTRKVPSMISCVRSATMVLTSAGSLSSKAC